jgi:hypothetical protein
MRQLPIGTQLLAGDTWGPWTIDSCGYSPSDGYSLKFHLRGPAVLDVPATVSGSFFVVTVAAADTVELLGGTYAYAIAVYKDSDRITLADGTVEILPDLLSQGAGVETRTWVEQALAAVRAVIAGTAGRKEAEYQIAGRMLRLRTPKELLELENMLAWKLHFMQIHAGQKPADSGKVQFGFTDSGRSSSGNGWWR